MNDKTQRKERARRLLRGLAVTVALFTAAAPGLSGASESLADQSLEDFLSTEITSVSKKAQRLVEAPSAIFVITSEDIRRSGLNSIPELLRMVPGLQVARSSSHDWAVTARGFNNEFANKLLVMVDGLSLYTHFQSRVPWDIFSVPLDDIERIEVVRGPGATLWGANAVNGVVNIITRRAEHTHGSLLSLGAGSYDRAMATARVGGELGEDLHYRLTGQFFNRDELETPAGADYGDSWRQGRTGMRVDWQANERDSASFSWHYYAGDQRVNERIDQVVPGSGLPFPIDPLGFFAMNIATDVRGGDAVLSWGRQLSEHSSTELKLQYDVRVREAPRLQEKRRSVDLAFQHNLRWSEAHELVWGLGARMNEDRVHGSLNVVFSDENSHQATYSAFLQDEITLVPERFSLTLGSKLERNDVTGWEVQPSARFLWTPAKNQQVWGSVSRAVRTPARVERDGQALLAGVIPAGAAPFCPPGGPPPPFAPGCPLLVVGDDDLSSEVLVGFELGYRFQPSSNLAVDLAAFYNDYENMIEPVPMIAGPAITLPFTNRNDGHTYGIEAAVQWSVSSWWKVVGTYSGLQIQTRFDTWEKLSPHHQLSFRSMMDLPGALELDTALYFTGRTQHGGSNGGSTFGGVIDVESHLRADLRLGWQPRPGLEISLVGQDLLDDEHEEFASPIFDLNPIATIERRFYAEVTWEF